jgi:hypothetical protein
VIGYFAEVVPAGYTECYFDAIDLKAFSVYSGKEIAALCKQIGQSVQEIVDR